MNCKKCKFNDGSGFCKKYKRWGYTVFDTCDYNEEYQELLKRNNEMLEIRNKYEKRKLQKHMRVININGIELIGVTSASRHLNDVSNGEYKIGTAHKDVRYQIYYLFDEDSKFNTPFKYSSMWKKYVKTFDIIC